MIPWQVICALPGASYTAIFLVCTHPWLDAYIKLTLQCWKLKASLNPTRLRIFIQAFSYLKGTVWKSFGISLTKIERLLIKLWAWVVSRVYDLRFRRSSTIIIWDLRCISRYYKLMKLEGEPLSRLDVICKAVQFLKYLNNE